MFLQIRKATASDTHKMAGHIRRMMWLSPFIVCSGSQTEPNLEKISEYLALEECCAYLGFDSKDEVRAYAQGFKNSSRIHLSIAIEPQYSHKATLGRLSYDLMDLVLAWSKIQTGVEELYACIQRNNLSSLSLFRKYGFAENRQCPEIELGHCTVDNPSNHIEFTKKL